MVVLGSWYSQESTNYKKQALFHHGHLENDRNHQVAVCFPTYSLHYPTKAHQQPYKNALSCPQNSSITVWVTGSDCAHPQKRTRRTKGILNQRLPMLRKSCTAHVPLNYFSVRATHETVEGLCGKKAKHG